jgi:hypothetical protein
MSDEQSPGDREGTRLLSKWHSGQKLKRRERQALLLFLAVVSATEAEHICRAVGGQGEVEDAS